MVLRFIDDHWDKLRHELSSDDIKILIDGLETLKNEAETASSAIDLNKPAKEFFQVFQNIEPLEFLGGTLGSQMRSLSPKKKQEDLQTKILNYCGLLIEKITRKE